MKTKPFFAAILPVFVSIVTSATCAHCGAQRTIQSSELYVGEATKGIRGEIEVISHDDPGRLTEIVLWVNDLNGTNAQPQEENIRNRMLNNYWNFYMPTNSFCGPVELRDSAGQPVSNLAPELSSLASYPKTYDLQGAKHLYFSRFSFYSGPGMFPLPLMALSSRSEILRFQIGEPIKAKNPRADDELYERWFPLTNYFDIKQPGKYTFTFWPKIYKRMATNSDVCGRIDLPPVSATFKWDGNSKK